MNRNYMRKLPTGQARNQRRRPTVGPIQPAPEWAIEYNIPHKVFPPDWDEYGKAAGPIRNDI